MKLPDIKVGGEYFIYDENVRIYHDENGNKTSGPWFRGHFVKATVLGETSRSWLIYGCRKIAKKTASEVLLNAAGVDRAVWVHENAYKISEQTRRASYDQLQAIAAILER